MEIAIAFGSKHILKVSACNNAINCSLLELIIIQQIPQLMTSCLHAINEEIKGLNKNSKRPERHALKRFFSHQIASEPNSLSNPLITDKTHRAGNSPC
jgi:hypothetical protein